MTKVINKRNTFSPVGHPCLNYQHYEVITERRIARNRQFGKVYGIRIGNGKRKEVNDPTDVS